MSIIEAIKKGEHGVSDYLEKNAVSDSDIAEIKRYQNIINSSVIKNALRKAKETALSQIVQRSDIENQNNFVLLKMFPTSSKEDKCLIIKELSERAKNRKIKFTIIAELIRKNNDPELLFILSKDHQTDYRFLLNFSNLENEKKFEEFYALQTSEVYHCAITNLEEFKQCLVLWDTKSKEIKTCFRFFEPMVAEILLKDSHLSFHRILLIDYIHYHTSEIEAKMPGYESYFLQKDFIKAAQKLGIKEYEVRMREAIKNYNKERL